jgi:hypothetical protein
MARFSSLILELIGIRLRQLLATVADSGAWVF